MDHRLERRVLDFAARNDLLPPGAPVLALVSGGADSTCLMHLLARLHEAPLGVLAFDHGLRPESAEEAGRVMTEAERLGLAAWTRRLRLGRGSGLQERARDARRAEAAALAEAKGFTLIATGHTASDQAETVLFRIARGSGRTGAIGMAPRDGVWVKPLLCVTAVETRAWCAERGLPVVDDPSNADRAYRRSRVRHELIPALDAVHPGAELAVARFAELLRDEAAVLDERVDEAWNRCAGAGGLGARALLAEHPAIERLLIRRLAAGAGIAPDSEVVARAAALARRDGGGVEQVSGGLIAVDRGVLSCEAAPAPAPAPVELQVPGVAAFGSLVVRAFEAPHRAPPPPSPTRVTVSATGPFTVRSPRPRDRIALSGGGRQAVGRLLAAAGVAARHRERVPVVVEDDRVVWVAGYRTDPGLLPGPGDRATVLEVTPG